MSAQTQIPTPRLAPSSFARKTRSRRFPMPGQLRALELGADELHARLEWVLRNRPRALLAARKRYQGYCCVTYARLNRAQRSSVR